MMLVELERELEFLKSKRDLLIEELLEKGELIEEE